MLHEQPGGGGHGDPFTRDPERVAEDVRDEKISLEFARREHGVVIDPVTLAVDAAATRRRAPGARDSPDGGARSSAPGRLTLSAASTRLPTIPTPRPLDHATQSS